MRGWNDPSDPSDPNRAGRPTADDPGPEPWYDAVHHSYDPDGRYPYGGRHRAYPDGPAPDRDAQDTSWPGYTDEDARRSEPGDDQYRSPAVGQNGFWSDQHDRFHSTRPVDGDMSGPDGPQPPGRRLPRPAVLASAAAAATLAVMVGVGALVLPLDPAKRSSAVTTADGGTVPTESGGLAEDLFPSPSGAAPTSVTTPAPSASPRHTTATATPAPRPTTAPPIRRTESAPASRSGGSSSGGTATSTTVTSQEQRVIDLVNKERKAAGCGAVAAESHLLASARLHSEDQAKHTKMSHIGSDGSTFDERIKAAGYDGRTMAENVAYGYPTPEAVMDGWMNSSGHRANILNCAFKDIGVGVAKGGDGRLYWTQNFGG